MMFQKAHNMHPDYGKIIPPRTERIECMENMHELRHTSKALVSLNALPSCLSVVNVTSICLLKMLLIVLGNSQVRLRILMLNTPQNRHAYAN